MRPEGYDYDTHSRLAGPLTEPAGWTVVLASSLTASWVLDHSHAAMRTWAFLAMAISLAPVVVWAGTRHRERRASVVYRAERPVPGTVAAARLADGKESALATQPTPAPSVSGTMTGGD